MIAVICGTPIPATIRVVQIEPGPMPTFTASAPAAIKSRVASPVATLPANDLQIRISGLDLLDSLKDISGMSVSGIHNNDIYVSLYESFHIVPSCCR